jgi:hypothetical protein
VPEAATRQEPVAPQAVEVAALPVPVAPTMRKSSPPKAVEADFNHAGCVTGFNRPRSPFITLNDV